MALEPVKLDDLTWSDMVTAIRSRIAADSEGRWTLHAPVDPGITLLELFAWLLEQRLYWMDQVPDSLVRSALALLGVDGPKPAQAAATAMVLYDRAQPLQAFRMVVAGTKFQPVHTTKPPLVFSTETALTLLPVQPFSLYIDGLDRTADLRQGRVLRLFPADGSASQTQVVLHLSDPLPAITPAEPIQLLFKLRVSADIPAQWLPEAVSDVPPPSAIRWWYRGMDGEMHRFKSVEDGTGGFRRSGIVRLPIPTDWAPEAGTSAANAPSYAISIRVDRATFTAPPRLERLEPNACIARNQWLVSPASRQENDWLPLPGNTIALSDEDYPPLEQSVILSLTERDGQTYPWQATPDFAFHGPADRVFVVDRETRKLLFGDGLTGRLPVLSSSSKTNLDLQYKVGGGSTGNLEEGQSWEQPQGDSSADLVGQNAVPAEGGTETETTTAARRRAAAQLGRLDRAVTRRDYEEIARTTPGMAIQRAHAAIGYHPSYPCMPVLGAVTVFIVPHAPREDSDEIWVESAFVSAPIPDPGALSTVQTRLESARLISTEVFVRAPRYRPIAVVAEVEADSLDPTNLRQRINQALMTFLDPLVGGDEGLGWPFGEPVRPSALLREIQKALDQDGEAMGVSIRLLDTDQGSDCTDVQIGPHDLVELREFSTRFSRPGIRQGGLR